MLLISQWSLKLLKPKDVVGAFSKDHLDCGDALSCTEEESDGFKDLEVKFPMQGYYITVFNDAGEAVEEYQPGVADILKGTSMLKCYLPTWFLFFCRSGNLG